MYQGGIPKVHKDGDLWYIIHLYKDDSPVIRTANNPFDGEVGIIFQGEHVIFKSGLLWDFEGGPCEQQSLSVGGHGYDRIR